MGCPNYAHFEDYPIVANDLMDEPYTICDEYENYEYDEDEIRFLIEEVEEELAQYNDTYNCYKLVLAYGYHCGLQIVPQIKDSDKRYRDVFDYTDIERYDPARDKAWDFTKPDDIDSYICTYWNTFSYNIEDDIADKAEAITDKYDQWDVDQDMDAALAIVKALQEQAKAEHARVVRDMFRIAEDYGFKTYGCLGVFNNGEAVYAEVKPIEANFAA